MLERLLRIAAEWGPAEMTAVFVAAMIAVFVVLLGVAMIATLFARDPWQAKIRYRVFQDLLAMLRRRPG